MDWKNTFLASRVVGAAGTFDPSDETIVNGAPYDANSAIRSGAEGSVAHSDAPIAEEIKRRQIALVVRYIEAVRLR
jgi:mono/diheme cytochrome c family protein